MELSSGDCQKKVQLNMFVAAKAVLLFSNYTRFSISPPALSTSLESQLILCVNDVRETMQEGGKVGK